MAEILHCAVLEHGRVQENAQIMHGAVLEAGGRLFPRLNL